MVDLDLDLDLDLAFALTAHSLGPGTRFGTRFGTRLGARSAPTFRGARRGSAALRAVAWLGGPKSLARYKNKFFSILVNTSQAKLSWSATVILLTLILSDEWVTSRLDSAIRSFLDRFRPPVARTKQSPFLQGSLRNLAVAYILVRILAWLSILIRALNLPISPGPNAPAKLEFIVFFLYTAMLLRNLLDALFISFLARIRFFKKVSDRLFFIERIADVVIVFVSLAAIVHTLGVPVQNLLAVGGLGTLAVGLATREIATNIAAGVALCFTSQFDRGELIRSTDGSVEGVVEYVGCYQMTLRGLDFKPTFIPNGIFLTKQITNMSRITHRRFLHRFGLRYQDIDKVPPIVAALRSELVALTGVDTDSGFRVFFVGYGAYSLEIEVLIAFAVADYNAFLAIQEEALHLIARVVRAYDANFAYLSTGATSIGDASEGHL